MCPKSFKDMFCVFSMGSVENTEYPNGVPIWVLLKLTLARLLIKLIKIISNYIYKQLKLPKLILVQL